MPHQDKTTIDKRYKYLRTEQKHYTCASRQERSRILYDMEEVTGLDRKGLIRRRLTPSSLRAAPGS